MGKTSITDIAKKIWANYICRNLILAVVGIFVLIILISFFLNSFTRHGSSFAIPDLRGMSIEEGEKLAEKMDFRLEVIDSVYVPGFPKGTIFEQNPKAESMVKKNRRIFLTINAKEPKKKEVPNVRGYSLRQAKAVLSSQGFIVGRLDYVNDIATNNVIDQTYKGNSLKKGTVLSMGAPINLVVGLNQGSESSTSIPNVQGFTATVARDLLIENSLNVGTVQYDKSARTLRDSLNAKVYRQSPNPSNSNSYNLGAKVDIYLTLDSALLAKISKKR